MRGEQYINFVDQTLQADSYENQDELREQLARAKIWTDIKIKTCLHKGEKQKLENKNACTRLKATSPNTAYHTKNFYPCKYFPRSPFIGPNESYTATHVLRKCKILQNFSVISL